MADRIFNLGLISIFFEAACLADHIDPGVHFLLGVDCQKIDSRRSVDAEHEIVISFSIYQAMFNLKEEEKRHSFFTQFSCLKNFVGKRIDGLGTKNRGTYIKLS